MPGHGGSPLAQDTRRRTGMGLALGKMQDGRLLAFFFTVPATLLVAVLMYFPMFGSIWESLFSSSFINPTPQFVGLDAYREIVNDSGFWKVIQNAFFWTFGVVVLQNLIGFFVALLLNQGLPGSAIIRSLILLPWVMPGIVAAVLWRFLYDPQFGLFNSVLLGWNIIDTNIAWLADQSTAMAAVIFAAVWKGFPFSTVIFLAALQGVDREQVEAATVDGAKAWQRLRYVILPSMRSIIFLNFLLTTIFTYNYFDMIWVTTRGGPLNATHIFPTRIYELGFGQFRFGDAAAYGVISVGVLAVFIVTYLVALRRAD